MYKNVHAPYLKNFLLWLLKNLKKLEEYQLTTTNPKKIPLAVTRSPFTPLSEKNRSLFKMSGKNHGFYGKITATPTPQHYVPSYQKMLSLTLWGRILD